MKRYVLSILVVMFVLQFNVSGVFSHDGGHSSHSADDVTYTKNITLLFEKRCSGCHGSDSPEHSEFTKDKKRYIELAKGPRMDTYTHLISFMVYPDTGAVMRRLDDGKNTKDGKPGNMHQYLGDTDEERQMNLEIFKDWIGNWTLKRWPDISKGEIDRIKAGY